MHAGQCFAIKIGIWQLCPQPLNPGDATKLVGLFSSVSCVNAAMVELLGTRLETARDSRDFTTRQTVAASV